VTRREFISTAAVAAVPATATPLPLRVPVIQVVDTRAEFTPPELRRFFSRVWSEAVRDFARCGIVLQTRRNTGEIRRSPGGNPILTGLERGAINVVLTRHIPLAWDNGRGLAGVSTLYQGHHLSVIALNLAHGHQVPFLSVNTCVHELLHVLLQDILVGDATTMDVTEREFRIAWCATRLWLFHDGAVIRKAAQTCLEHLRSAAAASASVQDTDQQHIPPDQELFADASRPNRPFGSHPGGGSPRLARTKPSHYARLT
jgi:hypothetical protein